MMIREIKRFLNMYCIFFSQRRFLIKKAMVSIILVFLSFLFFKLSSTREVSKTIQEKPQIIEITKEEGKAKFFEWLGIGFLVFALWNFRHYLGATSIGFLGGIPLEQQKPTDFKGELQKEEKIKGKDLKNLVNYIKKIDIEDFKRKILGFLEDKKAINESVVSKEFNIPYDVSKYLLLSLVKENKIRFDSYQDQNLYTLSGSLENQAIDAVKQHLSKIGYKILLDKRFLRVNYRYELDALIFCEKDHGVYEGVIEVKFLKNKEEVNRISNWLIALSQIKSEIVQREVIPREMMLRNMVLRIRSFAEEKNVIEFYDKVLPYLVLIVEDKGLLSDVREKKIALSSLQEISSIQILILTKENGTISIS